MHAGNPDVELLSQSPQGMARISLLGRLARFGPFFKVSSSGLRSQESGVSGPVDHIIYIHMDQ